MKIDSKVVLTAVLAVAVTIPAPSAEAQWMRHPPPDTAPHWWTLTDEISSEQLFAALQSREQSRVRLRSAVEAGKYPTVSDERVREISFFLDGSLTPHLVPMFDAFGVFAARFGMSIPSWENTARSELLAYGISKESTEKIILACYNYNDEVQKIISEVDPEQRRFAREVLGPTQTRSGKKRAAQLVREKNLPEMAKHSGMDKMEVKKLFEIWLREPWVEAGVAGVTDLHSAIAAEDWEAFRQFLLDRVAPSVHLDYFAEGALK